MLGTPYGFFGKTSYRLNSVAFGGTNEFLHKSTDLTGTAIGENGICAFWSDLKGGNGALQDILACVTDHIRIERKADDKISIILLTTGGSGLWTFNSTSTFTTASNPGWHFFAFAWQLDASPVALRRIDGAVLAGTDAAGPSQGNVDWTNTNWTMGATAGAGGGNKIFADVGDFYLDDNFFDISVLANERKFIDAAGKPVDLGEDGSGPTGAAPLVYFSKRDGEAASAFATNKGTGGGFTENGTLSDGASSPSD